MVSVMFVVGFVLAMMVRRLVTPLLSLLEETNQLLHCLLNKFLGNVRIFDLFVRSLMDDKANLIHTLLAKHANIRKVTFVQVK